MSPTKGKKFFSDIISKKKSSPKNMYPVCDADKEKDLLYRRQ